MKIIENIIQELKDANARISVEGQSLKIDSPRGKIGDELKSLIEAHKEGLISYVRRVRDSHHTFIPPAMPQRDYELSSAQRRLWVLSQLTGASAAYNMSGVYVLDGQLKEDALFYCFTELVDRHEILRTVFRENEQRVVRQFILPVAAVGPVLTHVNLQGAEHAEALMRQSIAEDASRPFELTEGPLLRATLYRINEERRVLTYTMHHIISDGWSMEVLIDELLLLYRASVRGQESPLVPMRIQYKDYAEWQQQNLKSGLMEEHKRYWQDRLSGDLPVLELPGDQLRPAIKTYRGGVIEKWIGLELASGLRMLCQSSGCTMFMGLLAIVKALLYRYTQQEDIIIGSPAAGREHADLEGQIGFYVNMLALRTAVRGEAGFRHLLGTIKDVTLGAYEHQLYPFDELVEAHWQSGDTSRHAFFDVVVVLQNQESGNRKARSEGMDGLQIGHYKGSERAASLFDLRFDIRETDDGLAIKIEYNSDIYSGARISRLADHLENLLTAAVIRPDQPISRLPYLFAWEIEQLLETEPVNAGEQTLVSLFEAQVARYPEQVAVKDGSQSITYKELNGQANRVAHFLVNRTGLPPEGKVGLLMERSSESIAAMLGVLKAGGMYVPMDVETPEDRLMFMARDAGIRILITEKQYIELANRLQWSVESLQDYLCMDSDAVHEESEAAENPMMNRELWDHVGEKAVDAITGGGWTSSYTGAPIAEAEMEEYAMNVYQKLSGYLHKGARVLEIGCSSGLTLRKLAPRVGYYHGTDLSPVIVENTRAMVRELGYQHVEIECLAAHEIGQLVERDFDVVVINSVIQHFHGHNYLRKVLADCTRLLKDEGHIFIGDVMDIERKDELIANLEAFKMAHEGSGYSTKTDLSAELFVAKGFFEDLSVDMEGIADVQIGDKLFTLENELTRYRYDVILAINKGRGAVGKKKKHQYGVDALPEPSRQHVTREVKPDYPAYMIYTSGTTGRPKGVVIEHRNVVGLLKGCEQLMEPGPQDVWTMFHSYSFDFSVWEMYGALTAGGRLVLVPRIVAQDPEAYLALLEQEAVTVLNQTPSAFYQLDRWEQENGAKALCVRYVIFGGEALEAGRLGRWKERHPAAKLINMYGITETTVHVTYKEILDADMVAGSSPIGRPLPGWYCYVLDAKGELVPEGIPGELYVGGVGVGRGYLNRQELTAQRFIPNPYRPGERLYRSGDKVVRRAGGDLEYIGRIDDQVKIRGFRIEPGEVNQLLASYNGIEASLVVAINNGKDEKELAAYLAGSTAVDIPHLRAFLSRALPSYMVPVYYVCLKELPLTINGKVDRKRLPAPAGSHIVSKAAYEGPRNKTEEKLIGIWKEILGKEEVGIRDDFFELGGHSLKATRLSNRVHKEFDVKIPLRELFVHAELADQARLIDAAQPGEFIRIGPQAGQDSYVVSSAQRRLWVLSALEGGNMAYNIAGEYLINGEFDDDVLAKSFRALINRHEILRTVFREDQAGEVRQHIIPVREVRFGMNYEDLRGFDAPEKMLNEAVRKAAFTPLDLTEGPLVRLTVYRMSESRRVLAFVLHHIISDGWSIEIMTKELLLFYNRFIQGTTDLLPQLRIQYKDYAAWQQEQLKGAIMQRYRQYWLNRLGGELRVLELPADRVRPSIKTYRGGMIEKRIAAGDMNGLRQVLKECDCTLYMGLLALVNVLFYRYTGQEDIIIGSPIAGREHADLEDQLGFYINMLPLRTSFKGTDSFKTLLANVREATLSAYEHQAYPFDELVGELHLPWNSSRHPLFDVLIALQNTGVGGKMQQDPAPALTIHSYKGKEHASSRMDLAFNFVEDGEALYAGIEYSSDIYNADTVRRMSDHLGQLLIAVTARPDLAINALEYLSKEEKEQLLAAGMPPPVTPKDKTIVALFEAQVERTPDAPALVFNGQSLTYAGLNASSNQLADCLRSKYAIVPDDRVGLMLSRSEWMIIALLGILKSGAAYVPIDKAYPRERIDSILSDSGCKTVVDDRWLQEFFPEADSYSRQNPGTINRPGDLAYVIYTSGSTGRPKGVMMEHGSLSSFFQTMEKGGRNL